jgi:hypothetical protein
MADSPRAARVRRKARLSDRDGSCPPSVQVTDDQVREAIVSAGGDLAAAAACLKVKPETIIQRLPSLGLIEELIRLRAVVARAPRYECERCGHHNPAILTCAFCGSAFPAGTPRSQHEALTTHVLHCGKHPIHFWIETARELVTAYDGDHTNAVHGAVEAFRERLRDAEILPAEWAERLGIRVHGR